MSTDKGVIQNIEVIAPEPFEAIVRLTTGEIVMADKERMGSLFVEHFVALSSPRKEV